LPDFHTKNVRTAVKRAARRRTAMYTQNILACCVVAASIGEEVLAIVAIAIFAVCIAAIGAAAIRENNRRMNAIRREHCNAARSKPLASERAGGDENDVA